MMFGGSRASQVELQLSDTSVLEDATGFGVSAVTKHRKIDTSVLEEATGWFVW